MDFRTQSVTTQRQQEPNGNVPRQSSPRKKGKLNLASWIIGFVVLLVTGLSGAVLWKMQDAVATSQPDVNKYQALFMTNGQVYFGRLSKVTSSYSELENVYYLQVQQEVQPAAEKKDDSQQPQVSLTKLGKELHGPTDKMHVSKDQILFWEDLKDDSTVVKAIKDYENKN